MWRDADGAAAASSISTRPSPTSRASDRRAPRRLRRLGIVTAAICSSTSRTATRTRAPSARSRRSSREWTARSSARVISKGVIPTRKGLRIFQAVLRDDTGMIEVSWPGQPFLDRTIAKGDVLLVTGTVRFFHGRQLQPREFVNLGEDDAGRRREGRVLSVYPATEGLSFKVIRGIIDAHLDALLPLVNEYLPRGTARGARRCRRFAKRCAWCIARVDRRGDAAAGAARVRGAVLRAPSAAARQGARARDAARHRFREQARAHDALKNALPFQLTGAQTVAPARDRRRHVQRPARCTACCRATSAAARRSSRCSPRCSRSRTAIRRRSWRPPSCSPSSTRARSRVCSSRSASSRCSSRAA